MSEGLLPERVVLISGGTAGLGAGIARAAAREGATVAVTGRRREPGEALAAELTAGGTGALFVQADVADVAQARACAAAVRLAPAAWNTAGLKNTTSPLASGSCTWLASKYSRNSGCRQAR